MMNEQGIDWNDPEVKVRVEWLAEEVGKIADGMGRYMDRTKELYRGILPFRLAERWETRAYWRARLQAWDEKHLADPNVSKETIERRIELGAFYGIRPTRGAS